MYSEGQRRDSEQRTKIEPPLTDQQSTSGARLGWWNEIMTDNEAGDDIWLICTLKYSCSQTSEKLNEWFKNKEIEETRDIINEQWSRIKRIIKHL